MGKFVSVAQLNGSFRPEQIDSAIGHRDPGIHPTLEAQEVRFHAVAEDHAVVSHL